VGTLMQDLKYAIRMLAKSPGFTAIVVLTLALGIGANTAIFSLVNTVLLRPLPYPEPQRVVTLGLDYGRGGVSDDFESLQFVYWRDHSQAFDSLAAVFGSMGGFNLVGDAGPVHVRGSKVSREFFRAAGIEPMLGREFLAEEDRPGGPHVVVLSYGLWRGTFGGDPKVTARSIVLNGVPYSIVGVLPPGFRFISGEPTASNPEVLIPLQLSDAPADRGTNYTILARLKAGTTIASAQTDADRIAAEFHRAYPNYYSDGGSFQVRVRPFQQAVLGDVQPTLLVLFGAVGFVLLIACVNVANLFLSRATARQREIAIRSALGATRARLFRQLVCESLAFAILAGGAGLALAAWGVRALAAMSPVELPRVADLSFDWRVLAFTLAVSVIAAIVFGSVATVYALRGDVNDSLKEGSERAGGMHGRRLSRVLIAGEVALSLVLLAGAGLLIATVIHLYRVPPGFGTANLTSARMSLTAEKYTRTAQVWNFERQVIERVRQLPGVISVATASATPLERGLNTVVFRNATPSDDRHNLVGIEYRSISPDYFKTLAIPLQRGRAFTEADSAESAGVAVVNESLARELWPGQNPIGKPLLASDGDAAQSSPREVVGVVADIREMGLDQPSRATVYVPQAQVKDAFNAMTNYWIASSCLVRTARPLNLDNEIRGIVAAVDPEEPVAQIDSMANVLARSISEQRFFMTLMGIFATLALVLAGGGIYGVLSYQVARRTHEIGIRMALGANPRDVFRLVLNEGLRVVLVGVAIGTAAALMLTRLMAGLLFGVKPTDPLTFVAVAALLVCVALAACYIPARRATHVDPIIALRYE
jgi:putative ABC transport system permease protein